MSIRYDEGRWPFLVITMPPEELSDRDFAAHLDRVTAYFDRGERFGIVIDALHAPLLGAERRRQVAERIDQDLERHRDLLIGTAVLMSSAVGRGVFKVIVWMTRSNHPMMSFAALEPALSWLRGLALAGRRPPAPATSASRTP